MSKDWGDRARDAVTPNSFNHHPTMGSDGQERSPSGFWLLGIAADIYLAGKLVINGLMCAKIVQNSPNLRKPGFRIRQVNPITQEGNREWETVDGLF
ncbi:MAG: hypothetical protein WBB29_04730 [Geitlerinemataceae cyanobacterium]